LLQVKLSATVRDVTTHEATTGDTQQLPDWNLGERLHKARSTAGFTSDNLAAHLGCSERTIRNYESGATRPNRATLMAWATLTDVPLWWLDNAPEGGITRGNPTELIAA
jgi:transcriptional regulator with XRE-family HTH domain